MKTTISTRINEYPIDITLEFNYNHTWLGLYVEEIDQIFDIKRPKDNDIDLYEYALDELTGEIEADLHLWLIDNSDDDYFHSKGLEVFCNKEYYMTCESEEGARRVALELNLEEYG